MGKTSKSNPSFVSKLTFETSVASFESTIRKRDETIRRRDNEILDLKTLNHMLETGKVLLEKKLIQMNLPRPSRTDLGD